MSYIEPIELGGKQLTPRHAEALRLAADGIPVIPCIADTKAPACGLPHGINDESADPAQIDTWWAQGDWSIGVRPWHMGLVALDLDLNKPGGVSEAFRDLLPKTLTHRTQSGNLHQFYKTTEPFGNGGIAQNVDVRCANGYVLWPPSLGYEVLDTSEPVALPEQIAKVLKEKQEQDEVIEECPDIGFDVDVEGARKYLENLREHPGRYQLACALVRNFGLSDATATALCIEYGIRIESLDSGQSWETKLAHGRKHGKGQLGEGVAFQHPEGDDRADTFDSYTAGEVSKAEGTNTARRFLRRRPSEAKNQPPVDWLDADNLFPSGPRIMVIYAEKENLKTQFVLAKGLEIVGRTGGKVLYIAAEDGHGIDTSRLPAYVEKRGLDWQNLDDHWWPISEPIDLTADTAELIADVKSQGFRPDVVVIDVMTACTGSLDINLPGVGNSVMNAAQQIAIGFGGALVVLITHPGKDDSRGPVGSYAFTARADVVLSLKRQGDTLAVSVEKMKSGPSGHSLAFAVEAYNGIPLIGARKSFERKRSPTGDDAIMGHLLAASAPDFASGLDDHQLAERIVGERQPNEPGDAYSTRVAKMAVTLRKKHSTSRFGESATLNGGRQLYWRWHLGLIVGNA
jgi:hypothetical protein